ncbi:dethiobiotin synthase [Humibacillus sp. DSM 29435]|uniref:dethiobiotin synthase n=1 Tax=Humibacillus sp. DSM 29435 TaxID=1869167 RepID=UPI00352A5B2D
MIVVSGTDTDVGKTVVTAAIVAVLLQAGRRVAAYKPTQTGVGPDEPGDMAEVTRLTGVIGRDGVRLRAPMAPRPAASLEGAVLPSLTAHLSVIGALAEHHDHVVVEGAGGLLVELTEAGETLADLAAARPRSGVVVVARSGLGTLNHTMLTREALARRQIRSLGIVIGAWPEQPTVIEQTNRDYLGALPEGLLGAVPWGAPALAPAVFADESAAWLPGLLQRLGTP